MKDLLTNPFKLIIVVATIALFIHGINIFFNFTGVDLGPLTPVLDTIVNLGNYLVGGVFLLAIALFFLSRFRK